MHFLTRISGLGFLPVGPRLAYHLFERDSPPSLLLSFFFLFYKEGPENAWAFMLLHNWNLWRICYIRNSFSKKRRLQI